MKHKKCEFCKAPLKHNSLWTVCLECDRSLKNQGAVESSAREKAWAASHKCRKCGDGLPLSRYFECLNCNSPDLTETESEFDSIDDMVWENA